MIKNVKYIFATAVICLSLASSGCIPLIVGAAAGAGGIAYIQGTLEQNFDKSVEKLQRAAVAGLKDLDAIVTKEEGDSHNAKIKADIFGGKDVTIDIEALTERSAKIKIRVGVFGDEETSQTILNAITKRL